MIKIDNLSPFALTGDQGVRSQGEIICIFPVTSHQSPVTNHQSPVTSHLFAKFPQKNLRKGFHPSR
ncbi:hypothetical protein [Sphaerospermopsis reniformis]|uniref:hypothetical protein n=1 Tax=Sphaerospermopsis reniformis TaxID=531300 RepID=UPI0010F4B5B2|nr:hypothetical protein [Sphaerospermopsis reniformis]